MRLLRTAAFVAAVSSAAALPFPWKVGRRAPSGVPQYVLDYAPVVYLHPEDPYFPSDIGAQLEHTQPEVNYNVVSDAPSPLTLDNLDALNSFSQGDDAVYLTSKDDITTNPSWLNGAKPDSSGKTGDAVSCAIIVNDHGDGTVDAFYMYFYAYNWGGMTKIFGVNIQKNLGNHVGDWEHNMIRFKDGQPQQLWYSQHADGLAYTYDAVKKYDGGQRPITFSANGSHANYATAGHQVHDIALSDETGQGPLWDPTLSAYYYSYDNANKSFKAYDDSTPTAWLNYTGRWGDKQYPDDDPRQDKIFDQEKYSDGPTGPEDKHLQRKNVCPKDDDLCIAIPVAVRRSVEELMLFEMAVEDPYKSRHKS